MKVLEENAFVVENSYLNELFENAQEAIVSNGDIAAAFAIYRDITERKQTERALEKKIEFNKIISSVSARFVTFSDFDEAVDQSLANIGEFTDANGAVLYQFRENEPLVDCTHEWHKNGIPLKERKGQTLPIEKVAWLKNRLQEQSVLHFEDIENLPLQAAREREMLEGFGVKSCIMLPLRIRGNLAGFMGFCNAAKNGIWNNGDFTLFNTLSMIIGDAFERKKAEDALIESEDKYRSVVERANDGIAVLQDGKIIFVNERLAEMWGGSVGELVDRPIIDFIHPDETPKVVDRYKKRMSGEEVPPIYETIMKSKDDTDIHVELNAGVIPYQGKNADLVFVRDVSERKQAQTWRNVLEGSIQAIAMTLEMRDPYTAGHQQRVTRLACAIAEELGISNDQIEGLYFAGLIHDIGKVTIPAEILSKPGRLTETEFSIIKNHPNVAYDILKKIDFPWPVARIVRQHHEYINGSGYPQGLKGDQILIEAKILTVADVVEAMASHRPYRPALGIDTALEEIKFGRGIRFDPDVVDACVKLFETNAFRLD